MSEKERERRERELILDAMTVAPLSIQAGISDSVMVRDLFEQKELGTFETSLSVPVNPTGVRLLLLRPLS